MIYISTRSSYLHPLHLHSCNKDTENVRCFRSQQFRKKAMLLAWETSGISVVLSPFFCLPVLLNQHLKVFLELKKVLQGAKSDTRCFHAPTVVKNGFKKCALVNLNYTPK